MVVLFLSVWAVSTRPTDTIGLWTTSGQSGATNLLPARIQDGEELALLSRSAFLLTGRFIFPSQ